MKKLTEIIVLRCTLKEKELLRTLAKEKCVNLSEYIKEKLFGKKVELRINEDGAKEI